MQRAFAATIPTCYPRSLVAEQLKTNFAQDRAAIKTFVESFHFDGNLAGWKRSFRQLQVNVLCSALLVKLLGARYLPLEPSLANDGLARHFLDVPPHVKLFSRPLHARILLLSSGNVFLQAFFVCFLSRIFSLVSFALSLL